MPPIIDPPPSGLILHLKADAGLFTDTAGTTAATADGALVARWNDQSGAGNHFSQATAGNRPVLKLAVQNGKPAVRFTYPGPTSLASIASIAHGIGTGEFSMLFVTSPRTPFPGVNSAFSFGTVSPAIYLPDPAKLATMTFLATPVSFPGVMVGGVWYFHEISRSGGIMRSYWSVGGAAPVMNGGTFANATNIGNATCYVGHDNFGDPGNSDIAEVLIYKPALTSSARADIQDYILNKYWSTSLPAPPATTTLSIPIRWKSKPNAGTRIDPGHPLSRGMIGAWTVNEGMDARMVNAASPGTYDQTPFAAGGLWTSGPTGTAYNVNGGGAYTAGVIPAINGLSQLTYFMRGQWVAARHFNGGRSITGPTQVTIHASGVTNNITVAVNSGTVGTYSAGAALGDCSLCMVFDGTQATNATRLKLYVNGVPVTIGTFGGTVPATIPADTTSSWYMGIVRGTSSTGDRRDGDWLWGRALSDAEVLAVHRGEIWDAYRPQYLPAAAAISARFRRNLYARAGSRGVM